MTESASEHHQPEPGDSRQGESASDASGPGNLDRLSAAMEAFLTLRDQGANGDQQQFLRDHEHLRDLLEPMLDELDDEGGAPLTTQVDGLRAGRQVGDYRLVREIGKGGMGIVFEAEQLSLRRRVALKLLHPHLALSAASIERFRQEATVAGGLQHPAIVPIHEVGEWHGWHFFSMEFIEGRSLNQLLHEPQLGLHGGHGKYAEITELIAQIADALQHAHQRGLVHRDVKPHNIMIDVRGAVHLLDFGLVKNIERNVGAGTAGFLGTPHYCSPEQARLGGGGEIGPPSDVFSLGIVMYELLTRRRPFEGDTTTAILRVLETADYEPVRSVMRSVPRDLETICHKALELSPDSRYGNAGEMAEDLRRFLRIEPIQARPAGLIARTGKWVRRHRTRVALYAATAVVTLGAPISYAAYQHQTKVALQRERAGLDQAEDLAFASIEQTLALLSEQAQQTPGMSAKARSRIDEVVRLSLGFLNLRAQEPHRRLRVARSLHVLTGLYAHMGQLQTAMQTCDRALKIIEQLATNAHADTQEVAMVLQRRRLFLQQLLAPLSSDAEFERATKAWRQAAEAPNAAARTTEAYAELLLVRLRALASVSVRRATAVALARRALALLPPQREANPDAMQLAAKAQASLGAILLDQGEPKEALQALRTANAMLTKLPATPMNSVERALTTAASGRALEQLGKRGAATRALADAIRSGDLMLRQYPGDASLLRATTRSEVRLSVMMTSAGKQAEAERLVRSASARLTPLVGASEATSQTAVKTAPSWLNIILQAQIDSQLACCLLVKSGGEHRAEARTLLERATGQFRQLAAEQPARFELFTGLGGALNNLAAIANQDKRHADAREHVREAIRWQQAALRLRPKSARALAFVEMHRCQLAYACGYLHLPDETLEQTHKLVAAHSRNLAALRMAAEGCCECYRHTQDKQQQEQLAQAAVLALRCIAKRSSKEARRWLDSKRFAALRQRTDFQQLAEECNR